MDIKDHITGLEEKFSAPARLNYFVDDEEKPRILLCFYRTNAASWK